MPSFTSKRKSVVKFADHHDPVSQAFGISAFGSSRELVVDEEDGGESISSRSSSSSGDEDEDIISKDYVEDSTTDTKSGTRSKSSGSGGNWFDDNDKLGLYSTKTSILVIGLVLVVTIILGSVVYVVTRNQQQNDFQNEFDDASGEIIHMVQERTRSFTSSLHRIGVGITMMSTVSASATATAKNNSHDESSSSSNWPFYTMENLNVFAQDLLDDEEEQVMLTYAPLVSQEHRPDWEKYSVSHQDLVTTDYIPEDPNLPIPTRPNISTSIYRYSSVNNQQQVPERSDAMGPFSPAWQVLPLPFGSNISVVNLNLLSNHIFARLVEATDLIRTHVVSELEEPQELLGIALYPPHNKDRVYHIGPKEDPQRLVVQPIFEDITEEADTHMTSSSNIVGHIVATQPWKKVLSGIIDDNTMELYMVVSDSCTSRSYTYSIQGNVTEYIGIGDLHETKYDNMVQTSVMASYQLDDDNNDAVSLDDTLSSSSLQNQCMVELSIYPTSGMEASFNSGAAVGYMVLIFSFACACVMAFTSHNKAIEQRQRLLQLKTQRSNAIVASLFPEQIRNKLFGDDGEIKDEVAHWHTGGAQQNLDNLLKKDNSGAAGILGFDDDAFKQNQVADLYPNCTVMFADISGFTAWSSTRDPAQVFNLLETIFRSFDEIAKRRRVFKVETIGDCYLAACGLPDPRKDHAVVMARFVRDILDQFFEVTRMLEVTLGPDTADLGLRAGLHSGPVTAGVLRGEKGRFQLFGDTVNTCSRLETTGIRNRIHISKETADLIREGGKANWLKPRGEVIQAQGKGAMETYWLLPKSATKLTSTGTDSSRGDTLQDSEMRRERALEDHIVSGVPGSSQKVQEEAKLDRLIFWVSESLLQSLRHVVARRNASSKPTRRGAGRESVRELEQKMSKSKIVLGEVREVITLPNYDAEAVANQVDPKTIDLGQNIESQLREYVTVIASLYQANSFHNFHHASHVTMSMMKLLSRIVAPQQVLRNTDNAKSVEVVAETLHDYTYGITSCPLTQFAVLLSAVIHDVDHRGVSNADLCRENKILANIFDGKSVAEQNSIDLAWNALMDPTFQDLRDCIYTDATELRRFRQLIVNCVLATDIFDKELSALRKKRWEKAFAVADKDANQEDIHRKATIVIEHLIQASDVNHTMQHWQVYLKWNEHFFAEQYTAFLQGRNNGNDPSQGWYKGEIWFFDNYVIPLAKKLKDCGVFGVSSDECLSYALLNREEWSKKGESVVAAFVKKYGSEQVEKPEGSEVETTGEDKQDASELTEDLEGGEESHSLSTTAPSCLSDPFHISSSSQSEKYQNYSPRKTHSATTLRRSSVATEC